MPQLYINREIKPGKIKKAYEKTLLQLQSGFFASAEVKKLNTRGLYRAKIDYENRLLFKIGKFNNQLCLLVLEIVFNHDYNKSRFLRGARISEATLIPLQNEKEIVAAEVEEVKYLSTSRKTFHVLDKILSFDESQHLVLNTPLPQVIIGSAGSGKTALTLEKMKDLSGKILYVTLSQFLAENSSQLFYALHYENESIEADFFSYREFLESLKVPEGREIDFRTFEVWFLKHSQASKLKDAHKIFEEFKGVLTGMEIETEYLSCKQYLQLGVKQSIFIENERELVYNLFEKYLVFLSENRLYDSNILSHKWVTLCSPVFDYIIIDEVQDFTNIQLHLLLKSLKVPGNFILCGDANQVVHPNFFSWSHLKTMFYKSELDLDRTSVLRVNYRNSKSVSELANRLLKIKISRFGSIDKESNFLVEATGDVSGEVNFVENKNNNIQELDRKTRLSANYAVLVMRNEDKAAARNKFKTPLLFSVQESKGLEYENIILYNFLTDNTEEFDEICRGVALNDVEKDEITYSRGKDKTDKSGEIYKFFINSLYVAITRAVRNVFIIEDNRKHKLFGLLDIMKDLDKSKLRETSSSADEWKKEAGRLEKQGKKDQADAIYREILKTQKPDWEIIDSTSYKQLKEDALNPEVFNHKAKKNLYDFALAYNLHLVMEKLADLKFKKAENYASDKNALFRKYYIDYQKDNIKQIAQNVNRYGINFRDTFNFTPLHVSAMSGALQVCKWLIENGANVSVYDSFGRTPFQLAIAQSFKDTVYVSTKLEEIYPLLVGDALKLQIDGKLVKIDSSKPEFLLVNLFLVLQTTMIQKKGLYEALGVKIDDFLKELIQFPDSILPEYRKNRKYLQPQMSKHEIESNNPYCKKLFQRVDRGYYILNPDMKILINKEWLTVSQLMEMQDFSFAELKEHKINQRKKENEKYIKYNEYINKKYKLERDKYGFYRR
jgi:hypothetical protein